MWRLLEEAGAEEAVLHRGGAAGASDSAAKSELEGRRWITFFRTFAPS